MKHRYTFTLIIIAAVLSGCNSTSNKKETMANQLAAVEKDDNYICKTVRKTGSNFNTRRCMTKEAYEKSKKQARDAMDELDRSWNTGNNAGF